MSVTTIQVKTETRDLLKRIGSKGETYDEVIRELAEAREAYLRLMLDRLAESTPEGTRPAKEILDEVEKGLEKKRRG